MKIKLWPIEKLVPYARNARKIPQSAIDKVAGSIKEFGFRQPIVVDVDGVIVAGHTRHLAAQKLGLKEVPVHVASELTPAQIKAFRLADNRTHEEATWDKELLSVELEELAGTFGDLDAVTAFDLKELDQLLGTSTITGSDETEPGKVAVGSKELGSEEFQSFDHQCPRCGFEFDK